MNKKTIKLNSKDIINKRDQLSKKIKEYWGYIRTENLVPKKAIKSGMTLHNLNEVSNQISQMYQQQIKIKMLLNAINCGKRDEKNNIIFDAEANDHYKTIYELWTVNEQIAQWKMVKTQNPATKAKAGIKGTGIKETFSSAKITSILKKLELEKSSLMKKIEDFNDVTTIEVDADEFGNLFAA